MERFVELDLDSLPDDGAVQGKTVELDLDSLPDDTGWRDTIAGKDGGTGVGDYGSAVAAGGYGTLGSLAAGADYLTRKAEDSDSTLGRVGRAAVQSLPGAGLVSSFGTLAREALGGDEGISDFRQWADDNVEAQLSKLSPEAKEELNAGFIPGGEGKSIWEVDTLDALGLKLANSAPSMVATALPGGIVAAATRSALTRLGAGAVATGRAATAAGTGTAAGVNATMGAGAVYEEIEKGILKAKEEELNEQSPLYAYLRERDVSDDLARKVLVDVAAGNKPILAGLLSGATSLVGIDRLVAGKGAGAAGAGRARTAVRTGLTEAATESLAEELPQEALVQQGAIDVGTQEGFDPRKLGEAAVGGFVLGGAMGGAVGFAGGGKPKELPDDPVAPTPATATPPAAPAPSRTSAVDPVAAAMAGTPTPAAAPAATPAQATPPAAAPVTVSEKLKKRSRKPVSDAGAVIEAAAPAPAPVEPRLPTNETMPPTEDIVSTFVPTDDREYDPDLDVEALSGPARATEPVGSDPVSGANLDQPLPAVGAVDAPSPPSVAERMAGAGVQPAPDVRPAPAPEPAVAPTPAPTPQPEAAAPVAPPVAQETASPEPTDELDALEDRLQKASAEYITWERSGRRLGLVEGEPREALKNTLLDIARFDWDWFTRNIEKPAAQRLFPELVDLTPDTIPGRTEQAAAPTVELDLDSLPAEPVAPEPVAVTAVPPQTVSQRLSKAKVVRIAEGRGEAVSLTDDPKKILGKDDKAKLYTLASGVIDHAEKTGQAVPKWASMIAETRGKIIGGGPTQKAMRAQLAEGRRLLVEETDSRIASGEVRQLTAAEAASERAAEEAYRTSTMLKQFVEKNPLPSAAANGDRNALQKHAKKLQDYIKKNNIKLPGKTNDPYVLHARDAGTVVAAKAGLTRDTILGFVRDDFLLRQGQGQQIVESRRAEFAGLGTRTSDGSASKEVETADGDVVTPEPEGLDQIQDELPADDPAGIREGADKMEAFDADQSVADDTEGVRGVGEEAEGLDAASTEDEPEAKAFTGRDRPAVKLEGEVARVGTDKAGTFQVAKRRTVSDRLKKPTVAGAGNVVPSKPKSRRDRIAGLELTIEYPKGSVRSGTSPDGSQWSHPVPVDYGSINKTEGADGEKVDVFVAPGARVDTLRSDSTAFVVNQQNPDTRRFDEHKVMFGFQSLDSAVTAYKKAFGDRKGAARIQSIAHMPLRQFKEWLKNADLTKPATSGIVTDAKGEPRAIAPHDVRAKDQRAIDDIVEFFNSTEEVDPDLSDGIVRVRSARSTSTVRPVESGTLGEYLKALQTEGVGATTRITMPFISKRLQETVADVPVHVVSEADMAVLSREMRADGTLKTIPNGYYDPNTHSIVLKDEAMTDRAAISHLMLHEGLHAAVLNTLESNTVLRKQVDDLIRDIKLATGAGPRDYYGLTNADEFVSEVFTSQAFQDFLAGIPSPAVPGQMELRSMWDRVLFMVRRALRLSGVMTNTMLDRSLRLGAAVVDAGARDLRRPSTPRGTPAFMPGQETLTNVLDGSINLRGAMSQGTRVFALKAMSVNQIAEKAGPLFQGRLDAAVNLMQRMAAFTSDHKQQADRFAERYMELHRKNPEMARRSAELRNDITMSDINVLPGKPTPEQFQAANTHIFGTSKRSDKSQKWQSKGNGWKVQEEFSKLPDNIQRDIIEEAKYYTATQNRISRQLTQNLVTDLLPNLSPAQATTLVDKIQSGTLTDADKGDMTDAQFNAFQSARELRVLKGMYFPLMRHGKIVVRTTDAIADLMGGKEVRPGVVAFRAKSDVVARRQAEAFAKGTKLRHLRTAKRFYDGQTGELIKADDYERGDDIVYEVTVQTKGVYFFDTRTQANKFVKAARTAKAKGEKGAPATIDEPIKQDEAFGEGGDLSNAQFASLMASARATAQSSGRDQALLENMMRQASVRLMAGNRLQQRSLPRRMVSGASIEYGRTALAYGQAASGYLSKLIHMPRIRKALADMTEIARSHSDKDKQLREEVVQEMRSRIDSNETGVAEPNVVIRDLLAVTMLGKLLSPAHSIINAMQPSMVTYPILAGEHGATAAALELTKAYKATGALVAWRGGVANTGRAIANFMQTGLDTTDIVGSIRKKVGKEPDGAALHRLLDELVARNALDDKAQFEIGASIAAGRGVVGTSIAKAERVFRQAPAAVEAVSRSVSAIAAFRLAKKGGMSEAAAIDYAFNTTLKTQFDYAAYNQPAIFNNPYARPFLQFKKYAQGMSYIIMDMLHRAFKGASKEDRRVAAKQFGHLLMMQTLAAGVLSYPLLELGKFGFMFAAMLGVGEGWEEFERDVRKMAEEATGSTWGELLSKGVVSRALGVDVSSRMSLAQLWTHGEPKTYTWPDMALWTMEQFIGASGGTIKDFGVGVKSMLHGDFRDGILKILPAKAVVDVGKAIKGLEVDYSAGEAAVQSLGFQPSRIAEYQEKRGEKIDQSIRDKALQKELRSRYSNASTASQRLKVKAEIDRYNKTAKPHLRLNTKRLDEYRKQDLELRAQ